MTADSGDRRPTGAGRGRPSGRPARRWWLAAILLAVGTAPVAVAEGASAGRSLGELLPIASVAPFALLLLAIAILPLAAPRWWTSHWHKAIVAGALALPFAVWLLATHGLDARRQLAHALLDYASFMALLASLFVISGGIHVRGSLAGTPLSNTALLGIGALLANLIGTTGASVLLIRPLLRANEPRQRKAHLVMFFIFVVSNCGGLLTPLGDPPLFLGFLNGVPFSWTLSLWPQWLLINGLLLVIFNVVDQFLLDREEKVRPGAQLEEVLEHRPLGVGGGRNFLFLAGVVLVVLAKGEGWGTGGASWPFGFQETAMLGLAAAAYITTPARLRTANRFTFGPIVEVAVLFAGIFVTMTAPLLILNARAAELGLAHPWQFFWAAGALSSFVDNAPTYLTFAAAAAGRLGVSAEGSRYLSAFLAQGGEAAVLLTAVSCGAVMMGANTYIGNGPNFMVKAIAEEHGVPMPSFFAYMAYSLLILVPLFLVVTGVFFR